MSEYRHKIRRPDMRMALVLCASFDESFIQYDYSGSRGVAIARAIIIIDVRSSSLSKAPGNALRRHGIKPIVKAVGIQPQNNPSHYKLYLVLFWL